MDSALWELLQGGNSEDEVAAIIRLSQSGVLPENIRIVSQFGDIVTCRLRRGAIEEIRADEAVASFKAPRLVIAEEEVDQDEMPDTSDELMAWALERRPTDEPATGQGVVIGIVDWGFDFAHPDFRYEDGSTRIRALWDQRPHPIQEAPTPYGYGVVHTTEDINRALATPDPYETLGYHPGDFDTDDGTHATHVASIAAGNGLGGGPMGIAPEADLVFVQLAQWGKEGIEHLGDSVTLLEAVDFILQTAAERSCVINLSMGRHGEQHDGSTLVEQSFDAILRARPGRAIVHSAGNYYDRNIHSSGQLRPGEKRALSWEINESKDIVPELEVWYSGKDVFQVDVRSPEQTLSASAAQGERTSLTIDGRDVGTIYHRAYEPNNFDNHIDIVLYPEAPTGSWEVSLSGVNVVDGHFHAWIERSPTSTGQSHFRPEDAVPTTTTGSICNGFRTIAVGAYDAHSPGQELAPFSSSGPTRDYRIKPDLVAPGMQVLAARSSPKGQHKEVPLLTLKSGTSMAAPHVVGTIALMFEVASRPLRIEETHNLLLSSARKMAVSEEDINRVGSGYLDIAKALEAVRSFTNAGSQAIPLLKDKKVNMMHEDKEPLTIEEVVEGELEEPELDEDTVLEEPELDEGEPEEDEGEEPTESFEVVELLTDVGPAQVDDGAKRLGSRLVALADDALSGATLFSSSAALVNHVLSIVGVTGLANIIETNNGKFPSAAAIFDTLVFGSSPRSYESLSQVFEIVSTPRARLYYPLQPGDFMVRRELGVPNSGHMAMIATSDLWSLEQLAAMGLTPESTRPGLYAQIVEGGSRPHALSDHYARLMVDTSGYIPHDQIVLRLNTSFVSTDMLEESNVGIPSERLQWPGVSQEQLEFMRRVYEKQVERASSHRSFIGDVPEANLTLIEGKHKARAVAAADCRLLLAQAREELARQKGDGIAHAMQVERISINSGYRSASRQFSIWQDYFPHYYQETLHARAAMAGGEHGTAAVQYMARYLGDRVAAPGYSRHNNGLAIDFGTREAGRSLGASTSSSNIDHWRRSWFFKWMTDNAAQFHYYQNLAINEPWHWEYRNTGSVLPGQSQQEALVGPAFAVESTAISSGQEVLNKVPLLRQHRGTPPDLILRWNDMQDNPQEIDVVVYLHGYSGKGERMNILKDKSPDCGLDFRDPTDSSGTSPARMRPTLALLPRGNYFGGTSGKGYNFPALTTTDGLRELIDFALKHFAQRYAISELHRGRLILMAHSGGGSALLRILQHNDPDEVYVFDALYQPATALVRWAQKHIGEDRTVLEGKTEQDLLLTDAHSWRGGALRVFYRPGSKTEQYSLPLHQSLCSALPPKGGKAALLRKWYRVEGTSIAHGDIPYRFGWHMLVDASSDVPGAKAPACNREHRPEGTREQANLSNSAGLSVLPGFSSAEMKALRITTTFETGRPLGFGGLAGNFDGQGLSFGLLQWNIGTGSLQPLLLEFARNYPQQFDAVFGNEASQLRDMLHQPLQDQLSFARSLNDSQNHLTEPWLSHFRQLAASDEFKHIQVRYVRKRMDVAVKQARQLGLRSERALALLFDIVTQHGGGWMNTHRCYECDKQPRRALIDQRLTELRQQGQQPTEQQMLMVIAEVIVETTASRWREKVRRRRMTIVEGRGTVHGHTFDLERDYSLTDQPWEKEAEPVAP